MYTSIRDDIKREFNNGNVITQLIVINSVIFIVVIITSLVIKLASENQLAMQLKMEQVLGWVTIPANLSTLIRRPWTLITHMFLHYSIWHIFFNMLMLYWFGRIIQEFIGNKKIFPLYIYGGLTGGLFFVLSYNIFPGLYAEAAAATALGASAAVMAMVVAAATLVPDYTIFLLLIGPVRIKYVALFMIVVDLAMASLVYNTGGHIAHLGGGLFGYIFIKQLQAGHDWSKPFNNAVDWVKNLFSGKKQPRVVYKTKSTEPMKKSRRPADLPEDKQQRVDAILDKIARSGYDSLAPEEKEFLFKVSKDE